MDFNLDRKQDLLRDGLSRFLASRYDLETSRAAAKTGPGWQPDIWRCFAEDLGILGATLPESSAPNATVSSSACMSATPPAWLFATASTSRAASTADQSIGRVRGRNDTIRTRTNCWQPFC